LTPEDLTQTHRILQQIVDAIDKETGSPYRGILYGEFMAVRDGVRLIECNVRFGDDALNLLPLLTSDVAAICQAMISGTLAPQLAVFEKQATVCKYVAPKSYPDGKQQIGEPVLFPPVSKNAFVYYGEITQDPDGTLVLGASRTAGVVGIGNTPLEAEVIAESICQKVQGAVRHRKDIGTASLTQKSISLMRTLRGS
jgi:phosphoribosylamine--glycine ligase